MALSRKRGNYLKASNPPSATSANKPFLGKIHVTVVEYNEENFAEREVSAFSECLPFKEAPMVTWVNVSGMYEPDIIERAGKAFNLHPLVIADILDATYLAKLEDFGTYLYGEVGVVELSREARELVTEQLSIVFGMNYIITFQRRPSANFAPILDRIRKRGRICSMGADYLVYSIIDLAIDSYYKILDHVDTSIEAIEDSLVVNPKPYLLRDIYTLKQEMIELRKVVWPLREIANGLTRRDTLYVKTATLPYFRDIHEYTVQIIEMIESSRDLLSGLLDIYLSSQNNRMNQIMKVLTIISTIFLPLMFLASFYGMNLKGMLEIEIHWVYPLVIMVMIGIALTMLFIFWKKHWFSNPFKDQRLKK
ncbi:MAG: magnesium and cobalt transport protein CorA [Promethearchaeota archaeon CR_4]|nr:MAG: magnesium and cobalt transport protein CorA [Candidatus Lokiarchaeota archaeon CR_4]